MTFDSLESSQEASEPIELYKFNLGGELFLYSNTEDEITIASDTYLPETISRSNITLGRDERRTVLTVTVPASNLLAKRYVQTPPGKRASLSIFRLQRVDGVETALIYKGSILTVRFPEDQDVANMSLQSIEAASSREIPRMTYMGPCNHILYDAQCKVVNTSFRHINTVTLVSGNDITVTGAGGAGLNFTGGYVKPSGVTDFRLIITHVTDVLTLLLPFETNPVGSTVEVYAGCNHILTEDCSVVFANELEYGGFAFVPNRPLFGTDLI